MCFVKTRPLRQCLYRLSVLKIQSENSAPLVTKLTPLAFNTVELAKTQRFFQEPNRFTQNNFYNETHP
jgi:hypothetical protein